MSTGPGEVPLTRVSTLDISYTHYLDEQFEWTMRVTNLTDQIYRTSRDDLAPFASGQDFHFSVRDDLLSHS